MKDLSLRNNPTPQYATALLLLFLAAPIAAQEAETFSPPIPVVTDSPGPRTAPVDPSAQIQKALAQFPPEPSLKALAQAALVLADADRSTTEHWLRAPSRASMLPELRLIADHDFERDESLDRTHDSPDRWGADTDRDFGFQISASWKLHHLVFHPDQLRVHRTLTERASRREEILSLLIGYFYERRRLLLLQQLAPPRNASDSIDLLIRIDELTASIDALTGGLLSRTLEINK